MEEPEVKNSYQYVFELRGKQEDTLKLAHTELQKAQNNGKHYYDRKTKVRKFLPAEEIKCYCCYHANLLKKYFEREDSVLIGAVAVEVYVNEHVESEVDEVGPVESIDFLEIGGYVA